MHAVVATVQEAVALAEELNRVRSKVSKHFAANNDELSASRSALLKVAHHIREERNKQLRVALCDLFVDVSKQLVGFPEGAPRPSCANIKRVVDAFQGHGVFEELDCKQRDVALTQVVDQLGDHVFQCVGGDFASREWLQLQATRELSRW